MFTAWCVRECVCTCVSFCERRRRNCIHIEATSFLCGSVCAFVAVVCVTHVKHIVENLCKRFVISFWAFTFPHCQLDTMRRLLIKAWYLSVGVSGPGGGQLETERGGRGGFSSSPSTNHRIGGGHRVTRGRASAPVCRCGSSWRYLNSRGRRWPRSPLSPPRTAAWWPDPGWAAGTTTPTPATSWTAWAARPEMSGTTVKEGHTHTHTDQETEDMEVFFLAEQ